MAIQVEVGGWEHSCCGSELARGDVVSWTCIRTKDSRLVETHHDLEGLAIERVEGVVEDIHVRLPKGELWPIRRLPSGAALRGFDDDDDGLLVSPSGGELYEAPSEDFVVTLRARGDGRS